MNKTKMPEYSDETKISDIIKTIRSWSLLWDIDELLQEIIRSSVANLNADFGYLLLLESNGLVVKSKWTTPGVIPLDYLPEIAEKVIRHGVAVYSHDLLQKANPNSQVYCVPMTANRGVLGVIYIQTLQRKNEITNDEILIFEMLGLQAASFLENSILYHSAITDPLTGLYSHRHFQQECDQMMRRAIRTHSQISMMIIDLDHFKQLNDKHGHEAGNVCLKRISEILKNNFRFTDIIARFGGDEFEILLPDASLEKTLTMAQSLNEQISNEDFPLKITGTIGIANFPANALDSQSLFLAADQALYIGKKMGRNCAVVSTIDANQPQINSSKIKGSNDLQKNKLTSRQSSFPENISNDIQRIDGFDIIRRIANSSNGEVMLAKQHELERLVALKRPLTEHLTVVQSEAFKKEVLITASLSHPGVAPIYTMGRGIDGRLYYTMKPIKGISLEELLVKWKNNDSQMIKEYNLIRLIHILLKASETVAFAHSKNIVHLDIQPSNIIIGEFGEITLIDWGKGVKLSDQVMKSSVSAIYISGSPIYHAPEQLINEKIGKFTDVYSLGIILYEILTNKTPFKKNSTKETIDAITKGIDQTQEIASLNYGIDPILSKACIQAINKDPLKRITATEFTKSLSRFAMLEADLKIYLFNSLDNPMISEDWQNIPNSSNLLSDPHWVLNDGVWSAVKYNFGNMLFWKTPIAGNFSFTCEGWVTEKTSEIAIICYGKSIKDTTGWDSSKELNRGYCFQFGADRNLYTKLARHGDDVLVDPNYTTELNHKYIITISYQDGWLHCYIDKNLVFKYRELHPFYGYHLGFYNYGAGSHYRPIEVRYQSTGLMIPALRLADEHLTNKRYEAAINYYNEIIQSYPDRLEGYESILKKGQCYAKLGNTKEAIQAFERLKNTILEPYALSEMGLMELPYTRDEIFQKEGDYKKAYLIFKNLIEKFKNHQAIFQILHPCKILQFKYESNSIPFKKNLEETLYYKVELQKLGAETLTPPGQSQIVCYGSMISHMMLLGRWEAALKNVKEYLFKFKKYFDFGPSNSINFMHLCYCCDEWQIFENEFINFNTIDIHPLIILEKFNANEVLKKTEFLNIHNYFRGISYEIILTLGLKNEINLIKKIEKVFIDYNAPEGIMYRMCQFDFMAFEILLASNKNQIPLILTFLDLLGKESNEYQEESALLKSYYLAINELFNFNFSSCLQEINANNNIVSKINPFQEKRLLLTCFLYSLDYIGGLKKDELGCQIKIYLAGPRLELANHFLDGGVFTLLDKWPKKPTTYYFDIVLYSIWLFEKKEFQLLSNTLKTIINPNLGHAYFQPFLLKLEQKLRKSTNS